MIIRKIPHYDFEDLTFSRLSDAEFLKGKFLISLPPIPACFDEEKVLLDIPNALRISVIKRSLGVGDDKENLSLDRECCFYFNEQDEWILELRAKMRVTDGTFEDTYLLRLPLSMPDITGRSLDLLFDGTWLRFLLNGEVLNENSGLDMFCKPDGDIFVDSLLESAKVAAVHNINVTYREQETDISPGFYFPHGFNTTIGDVMSFSHNGVYHLLYLLDRRHHGSRNGIGAHYICQLTTKNFVDWYEQRPVVEIDAPWKSFGTGTMLFSNGKYYMSYGLHTERYRGAREKIEPKFDEMANQFEPLTFEDAFRKGGLPAGATYSVSDDGINFEPSGVMFHSARNPSAYANENGGITVYCGYGGEGVFESESFDKPFKKAAEHFDFAHNSVMRNTSECPALFEWNGYKYLIVGFTGYYRTMQPNGTEMVDAAALGENIYDGLSVPMVARVGNRRILAGWVESHLGWGGVLMQRELIQEENGKLGMKWIPELKPKTKTSIDCDGIKSHPIAITPKQSHYLKLNVDPRLAKRFGVSLNDGQTACTLELDFAKLTAQVNNAPIGRFAEPIPTALEQMKAVDPSIKTFMKTGCKDIPQHAKNYALPDIAGINQPFTVKILLRYSARMRSTVLDAEIAGRRTLISVRDGFFPTAVELLTDGEVAITQSELYTADTAE